MKLKIDMRLLKEQIDICDTQAINARNEYECDMLDGIANLLSEINYALENNEKIEFEKVEGEE